MKKKATKQAQASFPKQVFITREGERDGEYLQASETPNDAENGQTVAVYELRDVKRKRVTHELA